MKKILTLITLVIVPVMLFSQTTGEITGVVTDENGNPLAGVNVIVEGTRYGAATDMNGGYTVIGVPAGIYSVRAEYIGKEAKTVQNVQVPPGGSAEANFELATQVLEGEEIVYIGYGVQEKKDLTGSVTSVRVKDVQKIASIDVATAIQGKAAGVNVATPTGAPGADVEIKIRGAGSLDENNPLVIVDGVPSELHYVDPDDIKSVDILKDASAAAIYGSRAGNGVMIITTKRGESGPVKVNFSMKLSNQSVPNKLDLVTNTGEYLDIVKMAADNGGVDYPEFVGMYEADPSKFSSGTDWQDAYFQTAVFQDYNLTFSGGSENMNFAVSGNYAKQKGIVVTTYNERMGLRVNSDFTKGRLKVGESVSISRSIGKDRYDERYQFFHLSGLSPMVPVKDPNNPYGYGAQDNLIGFYREPFNVIAAANLRDNKWDDIHMLASAYAEYTPMEGMLYTARLSQNIRNGYDYEFNPKYYLNGIDQNEITNMSEWRNRKYHTIMDHTLNYKTEINEHTIDALIGYSQETTKYRSTNASVTKFPDDGLRVLEAGTENDDAWGMEEEWHFRSYFGRVNYDFADKYLLQLNYRRDGSSRFSEDNRWGDFPSVSFGWRLSEEPFFNVPQVNSFKLRASYGVLGMQEFDDYMYYYLIDFDDNQDLNYPFGEGKEQEVHIGGRAVAFPSVGLKWEESKQTNIGFDMGLMNDKLSLEFDYYIKENKDVLYNPDIPLSAGAGDPPWINAATIENKGIELTANYREAETDVKYDINFTLTTNTNEVTRLGRQGTEAVWGDDVYWAFDNVTKTVVGRPIGPFFLFETDGIFKNQTDLDAYNAAITEYPTGVTPELGDVKYIDQNGDGVINEDDKKFFGTGQPSAEFGFNVNLSYKQWDFNMFLYAVTGKQMYNGTKMLSYWTNHPPGNYHKDLADAWTPDNSDSNIPRVIQDDDRNVQASDLFLEDADYLRLRHIELGYTFPSSMLGSLGVGSLRIYVAGENLFTLTGYSGYDPALDYGKLFDRGIDRTPYPIPKQIITGVQIGL